MSVYYPFGPSDIVHYNLSTRPKSEFASGTAGWRGSTGERGAISLYGGIRSKETDASSGLTIQPIYDLDTHTIDGKIAVSASYPFTGSLSYVQVRDLPLDLNDEVHTSLWGEEHFSPIMNLYEYYTKADADYMTASYDYYSIFSEASSLNRVFVSASFFDEMTTAYTVEAMIKPLTMLSADDHTIASRTNLWSLYIQGSDGRLAFSASDGSGLVYTSSAALTNDRWQHVAYSVADGTGSFLVDMNDAGQFFTVTGSIDQSGSTEPMNALYDQNRPASTFHGFMMDMKVWKSGRSFSQLSASFDRTLINSGSDDLLTYFRFNDGPRKTTHGFTRGSGSYDFGKSGSHGLLENFDDRQAPIWHPSDNPNFIVPKTQITNYIDELRVVHIPSMYYGRQIATGSVRLVCNSYLSSSLQRVLVDDGRGGLFLSGSASSASLDTREEYAGVGWNKVGNVFYSEGLIVIKDPSMLDFGTVNADSPLQDDLLQVSFAGQQDLPTKVFMCRVNGAEANASFNPSYSTRDEATGKLRINSDKPTTYISAVGLYNKDRKLVGVAKLASPIRNREKDKLNIRLKLDF